MNIKRFRPIGALAAVLAVAGCSGNELGGLGDVLGGVLGAPGGTSQQQGQVVAEIQSVDTRQQAIHVRTDTGESGSVLFDQNTVVMYQQQQYAVTALERGDVVAMQVQQLDQNRLYTPRIDVQQSVQERTGQGAVQGDLRQLTGRVGAVDHQRAFFDLETAQGTYTVVIPSDASQATINHFHSLRTGNQVSLEGTFAGTSRIDLYRFR